MRRRPQTTTHCEIVREGYYTSRTVLTRPYTVILIVLVGQPRRRPYRSSRREVPHVVGACRRTIVQITGGVVLAIGLYPTALNSSCRRMVPDHLHESLSGILLTVRS